MKKISLILFTVCITFLSQGEDGYRLWLRYDLITNQHIFQNYTQSLNKIFADENSATMNIAASELQTGLTGLLGKSLQITSTFNEDGTILLSTDRKSSLTKFCISKDELNAISEEGFIIKAENYIDKKVIIAVN